VLAATPKLILQGNEKKRVVDLRKSRLRDETESVSDETSFTGTTSAPSAFSPSIIPEDHNDDPVKPRRLPENTAKAPSMQEIFPGQNQGRDSLRRLVPQELHDPTTRSVSLANAVDGEANSPLKTELTSTREFAQAGHASPHLPEKIEAESSSSSRLPLPNAMFMDVAHNSSILEQAWMMKMAGEIARRIRDEKSAANDGSGFWDRHTREESPPPAYAQ